MNEKYNIQFWMGLIIILLLVGIIVVGIIVIGYQQSHPKWRYETSYIDDVKLSTYLEVYGNAGCVVDGSRRAADENMKMGYEIIFRCPK